MPVVITNVGYWRRAGRSSADENECAPVERKTVAVALAHNFAFLELGLPESLGLVEASQPRYIKGSHQFLRLTIWNQPHAHHYRIRTGFLQSAAQSKHALAVTLLSQTRFACAEYDEFSVLEIKLAGRICGERSIIETRRGRRAATNAFCAGEEETGTKHRVLERRRLAGGCFGLLRNLLIRKKEVIRRNVDDAWARQPVHDFFERVIAGVGSHLLSGVVRFACAGRPGHPAWKRRVRPVEFSQRWAD